MENFLRVIGIRIKENKEFYEGEVWCLRIVTQQSCYDMDSTLLHYSKTERIWQDITVPDHLRYSTVVFLGGTGMGCGCGKAE